MPFGVRHQSACATHQNAASGSAAVAGARGFCDRAGARESHSWGRWRSVVGCNRADPVFHPSNGGVSQAIQSTVKPEQFTWRLEQGRDARTGADPTAGHGHLEPFPKVGISIAEIMPAPQAREPTPAHLLVDINPDRRVAGAIDELFWRNGWTPEGQEKRIRAGRLRLAYEQLEIWRAENGRKAKT